MNRYFFPIILLTILVLFHTSRCAHGETLNLNSLNTVTFRNEVTPDSTTDVLLKIAAANGTRGSKTYPIYLVIDSPGGSIMAGIAFIDAAKQTKNLRTVSIFAASMASAIVEALPGERLITPVGIMMFHRAAGGFSGQFETGELESQLDLVKTIVRTMEGVSAARMKLTLADYKQKVINQYWLLATQAVQNHAADKVVDIVCSQELIDRRESASQCDIFGCSDTEYSACPNMRYPLPQPKKSVSI